MQVRISAGPDGRLAISNNRTWWTRPVFQVIKDLPGRRYDETRKLWLIPDTAAYADKLLRGLYATGLFTAASDMTRDDQAPCDQPAPLAPAVASGGNDPQAQFEAFRRSLVAQHYSQRTIESYLQWLVRFAAFDAGRTLQSLGPTELNRYLTHLAVHKQVSSSTQNQALAAILYYWRQVLGRSPEECGDPIRAKKPGRLPVVLSREEIREVLSRLSGNKWLMASLMYGTGMRITECLMLRVQDIDFSRNEILIRNGKGAKDRRTMLPIR